MRKIYVPISFSGLGEHMMYNIVCHDLCVGVNWNIENCGKMCGIKNFEHSYCILSRAKRLKSPC